MVQYIGFRLASPFAGKLPSAKQPRHLKLTLKSYWYQYEEVRVH
jgi:hypothetical protein